MKKLYYSLLMSNKNKKIVLEAEIRAGGKKTTGKVARVFLVKNRAACFFFTVFTFIQVGVFFFLCFCFCACWLLSTMATYWTLVRVKLS